MKRLEEIEKTIRDHKELLKEKYGVKEIGSYVKGEQKEDSNLDVLMEQFDLVCLSGKFDIIQIPCHFLLKTIETGEIYVS